MSRLDEQIAEAKESSEYWADYPAEYDSWQWCKGRLDGLMWAKRNAAAIDDAAYRQGIQETLAQTKPLTAPLTPTITRDAIKSYLHNYATLWGRAFDTSQADSVDRAVGFIADLLTDLGVAVDG